ncbi:MAG: FAD-dependent oxidoreductase [Anaerolineae bacterium]|nr:FAD-dependent oxidoreductase [Anaerolineae bacterium]
MNQVKLTIDGKEVSVPKTWTILQAAQQAGANIPTLCYHPSVEPFNSCLLCVVEIEGSPRLALSCGVQVRDGMVVTTDSPRIRENRRVALELLLSEHCGDCFGMCRVACPAHIDIQGFIHEIGQQDYAQSVRIIKESVPFPVALGCVCPAPCEDVCRRNRLDEPVAICALKRFAGEQDLETGDPYLPEVAPDTGKHVAIVGAGPAGLSAAYYLRRRGHAVTVFEAQDEPGGMLRWGIPAYRLPREKLAAEIKTITDLGIDVRYNTALGRDVTLDALRAQYDAVFLGIGAQRSRPVEIPGGDSARIWGGIELLDCVSHGNAVDVGQRVIIVGGGNTAVDVARTVRRFGAQPIIVYRRSRQEMPALEVEIVAAEEEGCEFHLLANPVAVEETAAGLRVTCIRMGLGAPDASGRRRPVPIEGSEFTIDCDTMVLAIGQLVDPAVVEGTGIEMTRWGTVAVDEKTLQTSLAGVFSGGDSVTGADIAVRAVAAGQRAAVSIHQYLQEQTVTGDEEIWSATMGNLDEIPAERFARLTCIARTEMPELDMDLRVCTFQEVELGFNVSQALCEADRCLECGCAAVGDCRLREYALEYGADPQRFGGKKRPYFVDDSHPDLIYEPGKCILCGLCVRTCRDVKGLNVFTFVNRGFGAQVMPYFGLPLGKTVCDGCLKCVEVCPTGALMARQDLPVCKLLPVEMVK